SKRLIHNNKLRPRFQDHIGLNKPVLPATKLSHRYTMFRRKLGKTFLQLAIIQLEIVKDPGDRKRLGYKIELRQKPQQIRPHKTLRKRYVIDTHRFFFHAQLAVNDLEKTRLALPVPAEQTRDLPRLAFHVDIA